MTSLGPESETNCIEKMLKLSFKRIKVKITTVVAILCFLVCVVRYLPNSADDCIEKNLHLPDKRFLQLLYKVDYVEKVQNAMSVIGNVISNSSYAVFSTTTDNRESLTFQFLLPLTALSWQRVGFRSIVAIVGKEDTWRSDALLNLVLTRLTELEAVVVFLTSPHPDNSVTISQVSRIFITDLLRSRTVVPGNTYVITTDADLWPINGDIYRLPANKDILSINSFCCGSFEHRNATYRMLPISNIGMMTDTWRQVANRSGRVTSPNSPETMLDYLTEEFGPVGRSLVFKGENVGWYMDQRLVSVLIDDWINLTTAVRLDSSEAPVARSMAEQRRNRVELVQRQVESDRIDRASWTNSPTVYDKVDAHVLLDSYRPDVWNRMIPLVKKLYGNSNKMTWITKYYDEFSRLLENRIKLREKFSKLTACVLD